ncbi:MAG: discoidin domain-containing protein [Nitrospira sp.]
MTIQDIVTSILDIAPGGFEEYGEIDIDGHWVPREVWRNVRPKPNTVVGAKIVFHGGKKTTKSVIQIVGALAILAAVAWVGGGGLVPLLGKAFAAGTFGAQAAAAGVGLVGSIALQQLSPAPVPVQPTGSGVGNASDAGTSTNALRPLDYMSCVLGKLFVSPPRVTAAYTTMQDGVVTIHAVVGMAGEYDADLLEDNLRVNDVAAADFDGLVYQIRPGTLSDPILTICDKTVFEQRNNVQLTTFVLNTGEGNATSLKNQNPATDAPKWHYFTTRGTPNKVVFRLFFPSGIAETDGDRAIMPVQVQFRRRGTTDWKKGPVFLFTETLKYGTQRRAEIVFDWSMSSTQTRGFWLNDDIFPNAAYYAHGAFTADYAEEADDYFTNSWNILTGISNTTGKPSLRLGPTFVNAPFPQSGWTLTTSSNQATAYRLMDHNEGNNWSSSGSGPHIITFEFDTPKRIGTFVWRFAGDGGRPKDYTLQVSDDGVNWDIVCTIAGVAPSGTGTGVFTNNYIPPALLRKAKWFRMHVTATGDGSALSIGELYFSEYGPISTGSINEGAASGMAGYIYAAANVRVEDDRFTVDMDPNFWEPGEYEFRIRRGLAFKIGSFNYDTYSYDGSVNNANWFGYIGDGTPGDLYRTRFHNRNIRGDAFVELFQTWKETYPLNLDGVKVALIAVEVQSATIDSISSTFLSVVPTFDGTDWEQSAGSQNGAALFRHVLTGSENARPLGLAAIDDDLLEYAYNFVETNGIETNILVEGGEAVEDLIQLIASAMFGFVARSSKWGIIIDEDRTGDIITQNFSPINTNSMSIEIDYSDIAHALYVEYTDEDQDYKTTITTVFLDGYDENNAVNYDSVKYRGPTSLAAVQARALYDLRVSYYRNVRYRLNIGVENLLTSRGRLVGLTHDLVSQYHAFTTVIAPITNAGNIEGLILEDVSMSHDVYNDVFAPADMFAEADIFEIEVELGAAITLNDGTVTIKEIATVDVGTNTITFTTPFADTGKIEEDFQVGIGPLNQEHLRCLVVGVERTKDFEATIQLVEEKPQIHDAPP